MPKLAKHCNISKYLENSTKENAEFVEILDDLCLRGYLRPHRMYKGMTLIIPDSKTIKQLKKLAYGSGNDWDEAQRIAKSYFLNDYFGSTKDFDRKKDDIPCALGKKAFEVIKGDAKTITVKRHGKESKEVVLEFDGDYVAPRPGYTQVMKIKKGAFVGVCSGPAAENKYNLKDAPEVKGGAVRSVIFEGSKANKGLWLCHLIGEYVANVSHSQQGSKYHNPFAHAVSSILCRLADRKLDSNWIRIVRPAPFSTLLAVCSVMSDDQFDEWYYSPFNQVSAEWTFAKLIAKSIELNKGATDFEIRGVDIKLQEPIAAELPEPVTAELLHKLDCISHYEYRELLPCEEKMQSTDSKTHCPALVNCLSVIANMMDKGVPALRDCDTDLKNTLIDTCEIGWYCFGCTGQLVADNFSKHATDFYKPQEEWNEDNVVKMIQAMIGGLTSNGKEAVLATLTASKSVEQEKEKEKETAGANEFDGAGVEPNSDIMDWLDN